MLKYPIPTNRSTTVSPPHGSCPILFLSVTLPEENITLVTSRWYVIPFCACFTHPLSPRRRRAWLCLIGPRSIGACNATRFAFSAAATSSHSPGPCASHHSEAKLPSGRRTRSPKSSHFLGISFLRAGLSLAKCFSQAWRQPGSQPRRKQQTIVVTPMNSKNDNQRNLAEALIWSISPTLLPHALELHLLHRNVKLD